VGKTREGELWGTCAAKEGHSGQNYNYQYIQMKTIWIHPKFAPIHIDQESVNIHRYTILSGSG
jgi:hypothetical protein